MSIDTQTIAHIANLANIQVTEDDVTTLATELTDIVNAISVVQEANTENVVPLTHPIAANMRRDTDEVQEPDQREALQTCTPKNPQDKPYHEAGYYLVPTVIES